MKGQQKIKKQQDSVEQHLPHTSAMPGHANRKEWGKEGGISKTGKKIVFAGIFILILGFFILTKTDPEGQNWASVLSPFSIVGAYIIIAIGIVFPEITRNKK
ncbi:MAG: hypothetical protein QME68_00585 [Elusimicrobiota bacterium]|nr:hypothetical protein [Elusimicrobiota bacterium]